MSFRRPAWVPRWAWGASAAIVQPPSGSAELGFTTRMEPPAQWLNAMFNAQGAWIDFLRGPDVEKWSRAQWPGTPASDHFNAPGALAFDVDTVTADAGQASAAFRFAVVGETSAPAAKMFVSQRGNAWAARTNLPSGVTGPFAIKALSSNSWLLGCHESGGDAAIYYAAADDGTAAGPLGANGNSWTSATIPASMAEVKAFAELGGAAKLVAACASSTYAVNSADGGATWTACTFGTTPSNNGLDVVSDGVKYVWVSQDGEVYNSTDGVTFTATVSLAPGASASWRLCAGAPGEVLAYRVGSSSSPDLYLSTDSGASWAAVTQPGSSPKYITRVAYRDGVWVATSSRSPWLWVSNDATAWRALNPPVDTSASPAALYNVRFDGGAWVAVGNGFALSCGRAADPAAGAYVAEDSPATLSDAGSLRGGLISTTAPTNGQVLAWNSSTSRWVPTAAGSSPTTTRGDLIRRGASADERFAAKAINTFVGGDGTDVGVRTVAQVLVSLSGRVVDPLSGSGWSQTTVGGAAAAAWSSGPARLSLTNPGAATGDEAYSANSTFLPDSDAWDLYARFDVLTGTSADTWFSMRGGVDGSNGVHFDIRGNGAMNFYQTVSGTPNGIGSISAGTYNAPSTSDLASGNFWARISRRPNGVALSWAVSSSVPTSWKTVLVNSDALTLNVSNGTYVRFNTYAASAAGNFDVDVTDIRATGAGLGPL